MGAFQAQASGSAFQAELDAMHDRWRRLRFACIKRQHLASVRTGHEVRVIGRSGVDYVGAVNGHAVAFDAKVRSGCASLILKERRGTEEWEVDELLGFRDAGAVAFLLVHDPDLRRCYVVAGGGLDELQRNGRLQLREHLVRGSRERPAALTPVIEWTDEQRYLRARVVPGVDLWDWSSCFPRLSQPAGQR